MPAQDPDELFDLCAPDGTPLGTTKPRALVHRDGDWHRSLHVWVVLDGRAPELLLQRRSAGKDTWPSALDVAVTGHFRAGETLGAALREADEEIGLTLAPRDVVELGVRRRADDRGDVHDHEIQTVLATRTARSLGSLRPQPDEVDALLAIELAEARRLFLENGRARARVLTARGESSGAITIDELVPAPDGYYPRALHSLEAWLGGCPDEPWLLG
jgi:isopentenyldiphosphate isomerase